MTANEDRLPRLLALIPWLRARPGVTLGAAAAHFGVTAGQIRKDIELLWFCGLPGLGPSDLIDVEIEGDRVTVLDAQTLDRPLRLTGDEGQSLLAATRALGEVPGLVDREPLDSVIGKLRSAVTAGRAAADTVQVDLGAAHEDPEAVAAARKALAQGKRLRLRYLVERRDEVTDRDVEPLELRLMDGYVYLHAWDPARGGSRSFRLDRVLSAEVLDEPASPPEDAAASSPGLWQTSRGDLEVVLDLAPPAHWLVEHLGAEDGHEVGGGTVRASVRTADPGWLARVVLRLGGAARVVSPPEVAAEVAATARAGLAAYGRTDPAG